MALAASIHTARTTKTLHGVLKDIAARAETEDATLDTRRWWHEHTIVHNMQKALQYTSATERSLRDVLVAGTSRETYIALRGSEECRREVLNKALVSRAQRWSEMPEQLVLSIQKYGETKPPPGLLTSALRTLCYAWCTTSRFNNTLLECRFCDGPEQDKQQHYLACPVFRTWLGDRLHLADQASDEQMHEWLLSMLGCHVEQATRGVVVIDVVLNAYDARRNGSSAGARTLLDARLKELRRRHPAVRRMTRI